MLHSSLINKQMVELCSACNKPVYTQQAWSKSLLLRELLLVCSLFALEQLAQNLCVCDNDMDAKAHPFTHRNTSAVVMLTPALQMYTGCNDDQACKSSLSCGT